MVINMAVIQCEKGHFYDGEKFQECPHCKTPLSSKKRMISEEMTQYKPFSIQESSIPVVMAMGNGMQKDEKTVGIYQSKLGIEPVVGWLVCTEGKEKGRSYTLHVGRNFVGRAIHMDVSLPDEEQVSMEDHCSIVFEPRRLIFMLARGKGESVIVNGEFLQESYQLTGEENIQLGNTKLVFIPFCKEGRVW
ncbi:MAG: FHA domain-containing protein [Eubacteriales bacterium]